MKSEQIVIARPLSLNIKIFTVCGLKHLKITIQKLNQAECLPLVDIPKQRQTLKIQRKKKEFRNIKLLTKRRIRAFLIKDNLLKRNCDRSTALERSAVNTIELQWLEH